MKSTFNFLLVGTINLNEKRAGRDINDSTWLDPVSNLQDNRIEHWWNSEEERIMGELRSVGKTEPISL
ncbi:17550_t:CDS:2 [Funneliformis geosporum]|nr:17550_t:CDS:2 [Funneliformis geosporum]